MIRYYFIKFIWVVIIINRLLGDNIMSLIDLVTYIELP
jgi:hypothetical protein